MAIMNEACKAWRRYEGGEVVSIGSYVNFRTMAVSQNAADHTLPKDGVFHKITAVGNESLANIATAVNTVLGTSFVAGSFHTPPVGGDLAFEPGQSVTDA